MLEGKKAIIDISKGWLTVSLLREFMHRDCPIIPVRLDNASIEPKLPLFLKEYGRKDL